MAYDPEARETGNSAMIIGIVVLVLLIGGALAYFATRPPEDIETVAPVVVDSNPPADTVIVEKEVPVPVEGNNSPDTVIVQPAPGSGSTNTTTTRIERERIIERPSNGGSTTNGSAPATGGESNQPRVETDVTVNVPSQPTAPNPTADAATGDTSITDNTTSPGY